VTAPPARLPSRVCAVHLCGDEEFEARGWPVEWLDMVLAGVSSVFWVKLGGTSDRPGRPVNLERFR